MNSSKTMPIVPLFDPKKWEKIERKQRRVELFPNGEGSVEGNWLPQNFCGGHQWNSLLINGRSND